MVAEVRAGASMRAVARAHEVSLSTVQWWCRPAGERPVDRVDWSDRSPIPGKVQRTESAVEDLVLVLRRELKETSDLGEYGARALHRELVARGQALVVVPGPATLALLGAGLGLVAFLRRPRRADTKRSTTSDPIRPPNTTDR